MEEFLDHGDVDAVQHACPIGPPVVQEVNYDLRAEIEGGVVECRRNVFDYGTVGEGDRADARD